MSKWGCLICACGFCFEVGFFLVLFWFWFWFFLFFPLASSLEKFVVGGVLGLWRLHKPLLCHEGSGSGSSFAFFFFFWFFRAGCVELNLWFGVLCVWVGVGVLG